MSKPTFLRHVAFPVGETFHFPQGREIVEIVAVESSARHVTLTIRGTEAALRELMELLDALDANVEVTKPNGTTLQRNDAPTKDE